MNLPIEYEIILLELQNFKGVKNAITKTELLSKINKIFEERGFDKISDRALRQIKHELNVEYGQIIGSCSRGYYIITNENEAKTAISLLASHIVGINAEIQALQKNIAEKSGLQTELF